MFSWQPSPISLLPCPLSADARTCAAVAYTRDFIEISNAISVSDVTNCTQPGWGEDDSFIDPLLSFLTAHGTFSVNIWIVALCLHLCRQCFPCSPVLLSMGTCLPGQYTLKYNVTINGTEAKAFLFVNVNQFVQQSFNFTVTALNTTYQVGTTARKYFVNLIMTTI